MKTLKSRRIQQFLLGSLLGMLLSAAACGYRVASKNRLTPDINSLAIVTLTNDTSTFALEQILTRSLVHEFIQKSNFKILRTEEGADAVLTGRLSRIRANPVTFGSGSFGTTFQVTVIGSVQLQEKGSGRILFQDNRFTFREQYVISSNFEGFFSEANPALERIARDFASSVVASVLESF